MGEDKGLSTDVLVVDKGQLRYRFKALPDDCGGQRLAPDAACSMSDLATGGTAQAAVMFLSFDPIIFQKKRARKSAGGRAVYGDG